MRPFRHERDDEDDAGRQEDDAPDEIERIAIVSGGRYEETGAHDEEAPSSQVKPAFSPGHCPLQRAVPAAPCLQWAAGNAL